MTRVAIGLVASGAALGLAAAMSLPAATVLTSLLAAAFAVTLVGSTGRTILSSPVGEADQRERARLAFQTMLDHSPTPMLLADGAALTAINRSARRLFGTDDRILNPTPALLAAVAGGTVTLRQTGVCVASPRRSPISTASAAQSR